LIGFGLVAALVFVTGCRPDSVHPEAGLLTADGIGGSGGDAPIREVDCVSLLNGLDPAWMFANGWDLPCPDIDDDGIENECDIDITLGEDCNENGIDDLCEADFDLDGIIDDCDDDVDGDGIPNDCDVDQTFGTDCDEDGQDDICQIDSDEDGTIDACEEDDHDNCEDHDDDCDDNCDDDCHDDGCDDGCGDDCYDDNGRKVFICHNGKTLHVDRHAVSAHLSHGDTLGSCED